MIEQKTNHLRYVAHELRTPLNSAFLGQQLLLGELHESDTEKQVLETASDVLNAITVAAGLLGDMIAVNELENSDFRCYKQTVPVKSFLLNAVSSYTSEANSKGVTVVVEPHTTDATATATATGTGTGTDTATGAGIGAQTGTAAPDGAPPPSPSSTKTWPSSTAPRSTRWSAVCCLTLCSSQEPTTPSS